MNSPPAGAVALVGRGVTHPGLLRRMAFQVYTPMGVRSPIVVCGLAVGQLVTVVTVAFTGGQALPGLCLGHLMVAGPSALLDCAEQGSFPGRAQADSDISVLGGPGSSAAHPVAWGRLIGSPPSVGTRESTG